MRAAAVGRPGAQPNGVGYSPSCSSRPCWKFATSRHIDVVGLARDLMAIRHGEYIPSFRAGLSKPALFWYLLTQSCGLNSSSSSKLTAKLKPKDSRIIQLPNSSGRIYPQPFARPRQIRPRTSSLDRLPDKAVGRIHPGQRCWTRSSREPLRKGSTSFTYSRLRWKGAT